MKLEDIPLQVLLGTVINGFSVAVHRLVLFLGTRFLSRTGNLHPRRRRAVVLMTVGGIWVVMGVSLALISFANLPEAWAWLAILIATAFAVWTLVSELGRLWTVGVAGADSRVDRGLNYKQALSLVSTNLSFLGTGAHKLTSEREAFDKAISACRPDESIRFLLRSPEDPELLGAAKKRSIPEGEYRRNVVESLRRLKELRERFDRIEVRFYEEDSIFRLMFIDKRMVLVSINIYGRGTGAEMPQLHLIDTAESHGQHTSFYQAFEMYFNERWERAKEWDFAEYM